MTGLSDSGKSTFARLLMNRLEEDGRAAALLDSDRIRKLFAPRYSFSREDRRAVASIYSGLCHAISESGVSVVCATVSMFEDIRRWNREHLPGYYEIFIRAPEQLTVERHPRGIFAAALAGRVRNVPGVDQYAETPISPDLIIENDASATVETLGAIASQVVETCFEKRLI
ncbi:MAG: adenylyl-sulfate kinase [Oricola sp.]|nr:adenylyl-sulfate kinase [Oricola sp.]